MIWIFLINHKLKVQVEKKKNKVIILLKFYKRINKILIIIKLKIEILMQENQNHQLHLEHLEYQQFLQ